MGPLRQGLYQSNIPASQQRAAPRVGHQLDHHARGRLAKALLALAYALRWLAATLGSPFSGELRRQARVFRRLLGALPGM